MVGGKQGELWFVVGWARRIKSIHKTPFQLTPPPFITKATFRDVTSIVRMVIIIVIVHLFVNKPSNRFEVF